MVSRLDCGRGKGLAVVDCNVRPPLDCLAGPRRYSFPTGRDVTVGLDSSADIRLESAGPSATPPAGGCCITTAIQWLAVDRSEAGICRRRGADVDRLHPEGRAITLGGPSIRATAGLPARESASAATCRPRRTDAAAAPPPRPPRPVHTTGRGSATAATATATRLRRRPMPGPVAWSAPPPPPPSRPMPPATAEADAAAAASLQATPPPPPPLLQPPPQQPEPDLPPAFPPHASKRTVVTARLTGAMQKLHAATAAPRPHEAAPTPSAAAASRGGRFHRRRRNE